MKVKRRFKGKSEQRKGWKTFFYTKRIFRSLLYIVALSVLVVLLLFMTVAKYPSVGAEGAEFLRNIIGDRGVASLEMVVFQVQDNFQMWKYHLGLMDPVEEWVSQSSPPYIPTFLPLTETPHVLFIVPTPIKTIAVQPSPTETLPWQPVNLTPLSKVYDEGVWIPYIRDSQSHTVAYKTFVQPDPSRPYTLVTIVAINLTQTRLHYVLGAIEPALPGTPARLGKIPDADKDANILLAEFNGGFQARHGQFGAMADGIQALPPRFGLGTLVIYENGKVALGEWGTDLFPSPGIVAFRQNGPLVIDKREINPRIYNNSPQDWGYTVIDVSPTVRSGIGLSMDNETVYYFCGPSLTMEGLAKAMLAAGTYNAIQLDINNYWVLFVKITSSGSKLIAEPLLPWLMVDGVERYLHQSPRDFFYITGLTKE